MHRLLMLGFLSLLLVSSSFAIGPKLYIGGNFQGNFPTGDFAGKDVMNQQGAAESGVGGEVDIGIAGPATSAYIGYRFSKHHAETNMTYMGFHVKGSGDWKLNRYVLGVRTSLFPLALVPVKPIIGCGLTTGKTKVSGSGDIGGSLENIDETSNSTIGIFFEAGAQWKIPVTGLSAVACLQYQFFDAQFGSGQSSETYSINFVTLQAGLRYILPLH
jgi:hypothetical protein